MKANGLYAQLMSRTTACVLQKRKSNLEAHFILRFIDYVACVFITVFRNVQHDVFSWSSRRAPPVAESGR